MQRSDVLIKDQYPYWIKFFHPNYLSRISRVTGKWVHHDTPENLAKISSELVDLIVCELTVEIKYKPVLNDKKGPFSHLLPPICIYSDPENKDQIFHKIKEYGLPTPYWQSEEATKAFREKLIAKQLSGR